VYQMMKCRRRVFLLCIVYRDGNHAIPYMIYNWYWKISTRIYSGKCKKHDVPCVYFHSLCRKSCHMLNTSSMLSYIKKNGPISIIRDISQYRCKILSTCIYHSNFSPIFSEWKEICTRPYRKTGLCWASRRLISLIYLNFLNTFLH